MIPSPILSAIRSAAAGKEYVLPVGRQYAKLMIVGDYPQVNDFVLGKPFSGQNGDVIRYTLSKLGFTMNDVYLTYAIKVRPEKPIQAAEIMRWDTPLQLEARWVQPERIAALGWVARTLVGRLPMPAAKPVAKESTLGKVVSGIARALRLVK